MTDICNLDLDILNDDLDEFFSELKSLISAQPLSNVNAVAHILRVLRTVQKSLQHADLEFHEVITLSQMTLSDL